MLYRILADIVLVVHLGFVLFVVLGGLLAIWRPRIAWVHVPAATWGAAIEFFGWVCPLTPLEIHLRRRGGEAGYEGGFIEQHLLPVLYPGEPGPLVAILLGTGVIVINVIIYGTLIARRRRRRLRPTEPSHVN